MDTNVAGLNKVYCFANSSSLNGRTVEITDGINTWTKIISSLSCVFMIPSMPAPAKRSYRVNLYNSAGTAVEYYRDIELGFGDSVRIGLYEGDELVKKGAIPVATSSLVGGVKIYDNIANGIYLDGSNRICLRTATDTQKGGIKLQSGTSYGVRLNGDYLQTYDASATQSGCVKVGAGLQMGSGADAGKLSVKYADGSNVGGIKIGNGLQISSGVASVKAGEGIDVSSEGVNIDELSYDTVDITSSFTIGAGDWTFDYVDIPSSNAAFTRLKRGFVEGVKSV